MFHHCHFNHQHTFSLVECGCQCSRRSFAVSLSVGNEVSVGDEVEYGVSTNQMEEAATVSNVQVVNNSR